MGDCENAPCPIASGRVKIHSQKRPGRLLWTFWFIHSGRRLCAPHLHSPQYLQTPRLGECAAPEKTSYPEVPPGTFLNKHLFYALLSLISCFSPPHPYIKSPPPKH